MKKLLLASLLIITNILYADGYYSTQDMVSYQDLQREISGIGVISDEVRIQKLNLGEVNPVVMKKLENYLSNYFEKKFDILKLEVNTNIRKIKAELDKKQSQQLQLVLNKLYEFKSKLDNMQFQIQKININTDYYKQVFNLYQNEFSKLTDELMKLESYVNKNKLIVDTFAEESYKKQIMDLYTSKNNFKYLKNGAFKKEINKKNNFKVLYNPVEKTDKLDMVTNDNLLADTIYNKRRGIVIGAGGGGNNIKLQSGIKTLVSKGLVPKTLENKYIIKENKNGENIPNNAELDAREMLNKYSGQRRPQPSIKQQEKNPFLPSFVK